MLDSGLDILYKVAIVSALGSVRSFSLAIGLSAASGGFLLVWAALGFANLSS